MNPETETEAEAGVTMTNLVDLIDGLIEPTAPPPVPLTPQTWGWVALALLIAALTIWAAWSWHIHRQNNAYRRAARARIAHAATAAEIAAILRRAALAAYPRPEVASLTGTDWLTFLGETSGAPVPPKIGAELLSAPYTSEENAPSDALRRAASTWIASHRKKPIGAGSAPRETTP